MDLKWETEVPASHLCWHRAVFLQQLIGLCYVYHFLSWQISGCQSLTYCGNCLPFNLLSSFICSLYFPHITLRNAAHEFSISFPHQTASSSFAVIFWGAVLLYLYVNRAVVCERYVNGFFFFFFFSKWIKHFSGWLFQTKIWNKGAQQLFDATSSTFSQTSIVPPQKCVKLCS